MARRDGYVFVANPSQGTRIARGILRNLQAVHWREKGSKSDRKSLILNSHVTFVESRFRDMIPWTVIGKTQLHAEVFPDRT